MTGPRRCVLVGGGAVGALFATLLSDAGFAVSVVDIREPDVTGTRYLKGDITAPDEALAAELGAADVVVLAVPEPVALTAVSTLAALLRPDALLVDTLSVKTRIVAAVAATGRPAVSLNPMFAPSLAMTGRPVAAVVVRDGPSVRELLALLEGNGARVVEVDAAEHDRLAAASQALTHATVLAFGLALSELDTDPDRLRAIGPPPHQTLLALLARIVTGTPEVYWDVQAANPHAPAARTALARAARQLAELLDASDPAAFEVLLDELADTLGDQREHYRAACARLFSATATTS